MSLVIFCSTVQNLIQQIAVNRFFYPQIIKQIFFGYSPSVSMVIGCFSILHFFISCLERLLRINFLFIFMQVHKTINYELIIIETIKFSLSTKK